MEKLFKWTKKPNGNCPVQSEGYFLGYFFYFRARGMEATIEFYRDKDSFLTSKAVKRILLKTTKEYEAGWLSKRICILLIFKGCFKFMISDEIR